MICPPCKNIDHMSKDCADKNCCTCLHRTPNQLLINELRDGGPSTAYTDHLDRIMETGKTEIEFPGGSAQLSWTGPPVAPFALNWSPGEIAEMDAAIVKPECPTKKKHWWSRG